MITRRMVFSGLAGALAGTAGLLALPKRPKADIIGWKNFAAPPQDWTYTGGVWVPSSMPCGDDTFRKQFDQSHLWIECFCDYINLSSNTVFTGVWIDGVNWASEGTFVPKGEFGSVLINDIQDGEAKYPIPAGPHKIRLMTGGCAKWLLAAATSLKVFELALPPEQS